MTHWRPVIALCLLFASLASIGMPQSPSADAELGAAFGFARRRPHHLDDRRLSKHTTCWHDSLNSIPTMPCTFFNCARNRYRVSLLYPRRQEKC